MWYSALIVLDIYLFWLLSNGLVSLFTALGLPVLAWLSWAASFVRPRELAELVEHWTPFALVVAGYYLTPNLPRADWFRHARCWAWLRENHTRCKIEGPPMLPHLESKKPVMYVCGPHSMYGEHVIMTMVLNPLFAAVRVVCTSLLFRLPISRECAALAGGVPANMHDIMTELDAGRSIAILPEGLRGIFHPTLEVLRTRHGFIRAALTAEKGCILVPVYFHGTETQYWVWNPWPWFQKRVLSQFLYPWPVIHFGLWGTFWPAESNLRMCIGECVEVQPGDTVESLHARFCKAMEKVTRSL